MKSCRSRPARIVAALLTGGLLWLATPAAWAAPITGTLGATGSDTMASLVLRWGEALAARHPGITMQLQAGGSSIAAAALVAGTTRLAPMSRPLSRAERERFEQRYGYPPRELRVARDALVVVVHRHNPLRAITRQTLDALFSSTLACGGEAPIRRWDDLPQPLEWPFGHIALHGRNQASGTFDLFRQRALCGGRFRADISEYPGSSAVIAAVGSAPNAVGYSGYHHLTPMVRALALVNAEGEAIAPTPETIQSGEYPLARNLYLYVNAAPDTPLPPAERAFIELILSDEGQQIVRAAGFVPLADEALEVSQN
ncbi:PstS family phosphate ABC transporter substrate-binding protein [Halomonas sp. PAMB 3264]|uniref:PstS family phosphate ABC transporter substrate-binding protein n=1 Tax=Halomonas sp. PAMB 3264 TaxID=3075222 RepID=UPI0028980466|nr:PstS family phosphate ABC transporter substrate-binding protein [Halomonas sp. PAMB 3264]WNL42375.1 PstS family phosphate ABC transporter substrate-binding protein [Halomonas sp. PAMB 3264]